MFELYDTVRLDQHTSSAIIDDFFLELGLVTKHITSSEKQLVQAVEDHKEWIDSVLKTLNISWTAEMIKDKLECFIENSDKVGTICHEPIKLGLEVLQSTIDVSKQLLRDPRSERIRENAFLTTCPADRYFG